MNGYRLIDRRRDFFAPPPIPPEPEKPTVPWTALCLVALAIFSPLVTQVIVEVRKAQPKIWIDSQWAGVAFTRGGYRSWSVEYSYGYSLLPDGKKKNFWHWPTFKHTDTRKLMASWTNGVLTGTITLTNFVFLPATNLVSTNVQFWIWSGSTNSFPSNATGIDTNMERAIREFNQGLDELKDALRELRRDRLKRMPGFASLTHWGRDDGCGDRGDRGKISATGEDYRRGLLWIGAG